MNDIDDLINHYENMPLEELTEQLKRIGIKFIPNPNLKIEDSEFDKFLKDRDDLADVDID